MKIYYLFAVVNGLGDRRRWSHSLESGFDLHRGRFHLLWLINFLGRLIGLVIVEQSDLVTESVEEFHSVSS